MESAVKARVLALSLAACWFLSGAHAACYYPSGRMSPNDTPCRDDTTHSTCCGQGYICLSNGMCQATETELAKEGASEYVRGSCTDKSWRSSSCPLFCIDEEYDFLDGGMGIAKCEDTTENLFFCINGQEASCENNQYLLYYVETPTPITTIGVAATSTSSSSSSSSSSAPSTSQHSSSAATSAGQSTETGTQDRSEEGEDTSSSTNVGAIVGGVIGGVAVVALAGVGGWLLARERARNGASAAGSGSVTGYQAPPEQKSAYGGSTTQSYYGNGEVSPYARTQPPYGPYEMAQSPSHQLPFPELSVERNTAELPADHR